MTQMRTDVNDYYADLGVQRDSSAEEIKRAYRKLARKYHPDVSKEEDSEARFKEVGEAYNVLKDPERRREYDELKQYQDSGGGGFQPVVDGGGVERITHAGQFQAAFHDFGLLFDQGVVAGGDFFEVGHLFSGFRYALLNP